ncbi:putative PEP-binding protein [Pelagibacterium montanilacus]|uniref:putative PEP-binding protein n=1 Tax=Pelagibacterium montanilacus TaxID=2185280 RepID=UPI0013E06F37|nr:putative PEP-binding protein [Pelagibacterium montanilacus]
MALSHHIFAIAPAQGRPSVSKAQGRLLVGKAKWVFAAAQAGLPTVPTIVITRAAWRALQEEREAGGDSLRRVWVATLFKLVGADTRPPELVVRTSAPRHMPGLRPARTGLPAPGRPEDSVDPARPLGKAITAAFDSYGGGDPALAGPDDIDVENSIVIVQAFARGDLIQFLTRNATSGRMGPVALPGGKLPPLPDNALKLARTIDAVSGRHMACLVSLADGEAALVSARPVQVSAGAHLEAAIDRVDANVWSSADAVRRFNAAQLPQLLHPRLATPEHDTAIASGLGVSPGAASGEIVFTADDAARCRARGRHCILVVMETGPGDIEGMKAATGFLTARGGMTSHAAVVARITGKPCVAGVRSLSIDPVAGTCRIGEQTFNAGEQITIDGNDGGIFSGRLPLSRPHLGGAMSRLLDWADDSRTISVRTNAETIEAALNALSFGAEGIGLARSEHMFFSGDRMLALRRLILSESEADRASALEGLVDYQAADYAELFAIMQDKPVNVRLFDPPLHEFLPRSAEDVEETASALGLSVETLKGRLQRLNEVNPMLGHRGCRLVITYPEILAMQVKALILGVETAMDKQDMPVNLEIMVPFVTSAREVAWIKKRVHDMVAQSPAFAHGATMRFGTMIELPRACLRAGEIAREVDFFSFGTNDLTQTTYGISRDDAPAFLATYHRKGIYDADPFVTIDTRGVGELIRIAIERGRQANPALTIGICGEHAGDPESLRFFSGLDIDYVSCSPYRVPVARLVLAQSLA